jgi:GNAT superfamily N-acetyltransferase
MEITYHRIRKSDKKNIDFLVKTCLENLPRKDFFIPFSKEDLKKFFDEKYGIRIGAYDGEKIVGIGCLYIDQNELSKIKSVLEISNKKVCELGDYLVLPEYRGHGIMRTIQSMLIDIAIESQFEVITSTVHPENIASLSVLSKHLQVIKTTEYNGYLRNIMMKDIERERERERERGGLTLKPLLFLFRPRNLRQTMGLLILLCVALFCAFQSMHCKECRPFSSNPHR